MAANHERDAFWSTIQARGRVLLFGGIFCLFSPAMILPVRFDDPRWTAIVFAAICSGLIGMFWALAFTRNMWFLAAALSIQAATMIGFMNFAPEWLWPRSVGFYAPGAFAMALIVVGYILLIVFINTEGKRSVRERTELALAQQIHATLVPPIRLAAHGYEILGRSTPSTEVGGDLVTATRGDDGIDLDLGDVTGHGVRSGVVMAMTRSAVYAARTRGETLGELLSETNDMLAELTGSGIFVTFAALRLDPGGGIRYALAGHLPIFHWSAETRRITRYENESLPLGVAPDQDFVERSVGSSPGDLLVVLTDGLIEVQDRAGRQLGLDGFERLIVEVADRPLDEIFSHLTDAVRARGPGDDDQTLLLIRRS